MLTSLTLQDRPRECLAATGRTHDEWARVLLAWAAASAGRAPPDKTWEGKLRQRQGGGGAPGVLAPREDQRLCRLVSQKTMPRPTMHGVHGDLSPPQTHAWMHRWLPVVPRA